MTSKAIELLKSMDCGIIDHVGRLMLDMNVPDIEAFYAAAQKELLERLTAGVEVPEPAFVQYEQPRFYKDEGVTKHWHSPEQLLEHGAAQRLLGAKEEREACLIETAVGMEHINNAIRARGEEVRGLIK